jgi:hypothetical protein
MKLKLKRNDKIGLFFFVAFIISMTFFYFFEERFDSEIWKTQHTKRYKMAKDIVEEKLLLGKTKDEVFKLLGKSDFSENTDSNIMIYYLGTPPSFFDAEPQKLVVKFSEGKVVGLAVLQE